MTAVERSSVDDASLLEDDDDIGVENLLSMSEVMAVRGRVASEASNCEYPTNI